MTPPRGQPREFVEQARPLVRRSGILGTGRFVPDRVLSNRELEEIVETSDDWIYSRTGMRERRIVAAGEATSDLASRAAMAALESAGVRAEDIELIIVATTTPDEVCCPPTVCHVQSRIGATRAAGFDLSAACTGFVNALMTADGLIAAGRFRNALVIGADTLSAVTNYEDRESCILFGDGAGAVVLGVDPDGGELLDHLVGTDGSGAELIQVPSGGSRQPASHATIDRREHFLQMQGRKVFRFAVAKMCEMVHTLTERNGIAVADIDVLIPHQANLRIIESAADKLGVSMDKVFVNIERYGNTSTASVPMALHDAAAEGRIKPGQLVCLAAFGGGLTWGGTLLRW